MRSHFSSRFRSFVSVALAIYPILFFLISTPANADSTDFQLLRHDVRIALFVHLPNGDLERLRPNRFRAPAETSWHMVQPPFAPHQKPGGFNPTFRAIYGLFHDRALPSNATQIFFPEVQRSRDKVADMQIGPLSKIFNSAERQDCNSPVAESMASIRMICLLQRLRRDATEIIAVAIMLEDGQRALLVFEGHQLISALANFEQCRNGPQVDLDNCARRPALLLHDMPSFNELLGREVKVILKPSGKVELALGLDRFFEVTSFRHPADLLETETTEKQSSLFFSVTRTDDEELGGNPRAPGLDFANETLVRFPENAIAGVTNPIVRVAIERDTDDLRKALLPRKGSHAKAYALPNWLYSRLASVALDVQAVDGHYCRAARSSEVLWRNSKFDILLGAPQSARLDVSAAPNFDRTQLYSSDCGSALTLQQSPVLVLDETFSSSDFSAGLCGVQRSTSDPITGVAGQYSMSPVIDAPRSWGKQAPFYLAQTGEGTFVQSRQVTLGAFSDYLVSLKGCSDFRNSEGFAGSMLRCDEAGRFRLKSHGVTESDVPKFVSFRYFYGAVGAAMTEATGLPTPGLACHNSHATRQTSPARREADALCALQFFWAARATDRLEKNELIAPTPSESSAAGGGANWDPLLALIDDQGDVDVERAARFQDFKGCAANDVDSPAAQSLCSALDRYINAAFNRINDTPWQDAPITMVSLGDATRYRDWRAASAKDSPDACQAQLSLSTKDDLIAIAPNEDRLRNILLPKMKAVFDELGVGRGFYASAVIAGTIDVQTTKGSDLRVAGLPVGFRELTLKGPTAVLPDFQKAGALDTGFGLSPLAAVRYFKELETYNGRCLECRTASSSFWWKVWNMPVRDNPLSMRGSDAWKRGDPATGFRLALRLKIRSAE